MEDKVVYPKKEQLIIKAIGENDNELGIRFVEIEKQASRGFLIKDVVKLDGEYEFMFILEREIR